MSNFKNVLKVFKMMREFESDDHALLNTLRGATDTDIELLIEAVGPQKRATAKRTRKSSKSPRAASLAGAIGGTVAGNGRQRCGYIMQTGANTGDACNAWEINSIHDPAAGYAGYHPFQPAVPTEASGF